MSQEILTKLSAEKMWHSPQVVEGIKQGDMPGDKVNIGEGHIAKANVIFPELLRILPEVLTNNPHQRAVITVCGGSGVGKSEIASLLSYYFEAINIGSYTLSGDNYPHRIPKYNDAERLRIFRESGVRAMVESGIYTRDKFEVLHQLQIAGDDANTDHNNEYDWFNTYLEGGKKGLRGYLGTPNEIRFEEIEEIVNNFKNGKEHIWLKRMGRDETELWFEEVDFSNINILIIEWTHGNSDYYQGVDIPILLNSTPQETLAHRRERNRDGKTDSPFTMRVLEIEQAFLERQARKAKIIISKQGELLDYKRYEVLMAMSKEDMHD